MKTWLLLTSLLLAAPHWARAESVAAIVNPENEETYQEAPLGQSLPDRPAPTLNVPAETNQASILEGEPQKLGRNHWYDDLNVDGNIKHHKHRKIMVVQDGDDTIYIPAQKSRAPQASARVSKIDEALNRKIAALRSQINQNILRTVENMNVQVQ